MRTVLCTFIALLSVIYCADKKDSTLTFAVVDPLAKQNACDCIAGFAQRDYTALATFLSKETGLSIKPAFGMDLDSAESDGDKHPALIIGKVSQVEAESKAKKLRVTRIAMLSDKNGKTTFRGLFVVRGKDPATSVKDLKGKTILFGPKSAAEKHSAALAALKEAGVDVKGPLKIAETCTDAGIDVVGETADAAAVSDYALALVVGCKAIAKGELKTIGKTAEEPFIGIYTTEHFPKGQIETLRKGLKALSDERELLEKMETKGFVIDTDDVSGSTWPDWLGPHRNGLTPAVPKTLPAKPDILWTTPLTGQSLGGVSTDGNVVLLSDKSEDKATDRWLCLNAKTGEEIWAVENAAEGEMDFTNAPRATPVIHGDRVILLNAFGLLQCVKLKDGSLAWERDPAAEFHGDLPTWGFCCTPYVIDGNVIVTGGASDALLVAYRLEDGELAWKTPGPPAGYGNYLLRESDGVKQLIGYDKKNVGGWDVKTGKRLWSVTITDSDDFYVPTPLAVGTSVAFITETGGAKLFSFEESGKPAPSPTAVNDAVFPDISSPVLVGGRIWCCSDDGTYCLDAKTLKVVWKNESEPMQGAANVFGSKEHVLIVYKNGHVALLPATIKPDESAILHHYFPDKEVWSQPALIRGRLFVRTDSEIHCLKIL